LPVRCRNRAEAATSLRQDRPKAGHLVTLPPQRGLHVNPLRRGALHVQEQRRRAATSGRTSMTICPVPRMLMSAPGKVISASLFMVSDDLPTIS
jgi:hypothetical protein